MPEIIDQGIEVATNGPIVELQTSTVTRLLVDGVAVGAHETMPTALSPTEFKDENVGLVLTSTAEAQLDSKVQFERQGGSLLRISFGGTALVAAGGAFVTGYETAISNSNVVKVAYGVGAAACTVLSGLLGLTAYAVPRAMIQQAEMTRDTKAEAIRSYITEATSASA